LEAETAAGVTMTVGAKGFVPVGRELATEAPDARYDASVPATTAAEYEIAWRGLRRLRAWSAAAWAITIACWFFVMKFGPSLAGVLVFVPCILGVVFVSMRIAAFPCPRCGSKFARYRGRSVDSRACAHCGLRRYDLPG
jgi:hypothetical protein